jgi:hypothetical protein
MGQLKVPAVLLSKKKELRITHRAEGWMGLKTGLDTLEEKKNFLSQPVIDPRSLDIQN